MKRIIYISGIINLNLFLVGAYLKIYHMPGAGIIISLALFLFCFWFLPTALLNYYRTHKDKKTKMLMIATYITFFVVFIGAWFKIQHWPGAHILLIIGIPLPFLLFLPVYIYYSAKQKSYSASNFLSMSFGMIFIAIFSVLLSLGLSKTVLDNIARSTANINSINKNIFNNSGSGNWNEKNLTIKTIKEKYDSVAQCIDGIINDLLIGSHNQAVKDINDINPLKLKNKFDKKTVMLALFKNKKAIELKERINDYRNYIISCDSINNNDFKQLTNDLLDMSDLSIIYNSIKRELVPWEDSFLRDNCMISSLQTLLTLKNTVNFIEFEALSLLGELQI